MEEDETYSLPSTQQPKRGPHPLLFVWFGLLVFGLNVHSLWTRLSIELGGKIVSSVEIPGPHGGATRYIIEDNQGQRKNYTAVEVDGELPEHLPVGTVIEKHKWQTSFKENGTTVDSYWVYTFSTLIVVGFCIIMWGVRLWRSFKEAYD
jgi:hypothetical protein